MDCFDKKILVKNMKQLTFKICVYVLLSLNVVIFFSQLHFNSWNSLNLNWERRIQSLDNGSDVGSTEGTPRFLTTTEASDTVTVRSTGCKTKPRVKLNLNADDVIVFLHIQKTGGMHLRRLLVSWIQDVPECRCSGLCVCQTGNNVTWLAAWFIRGFTCGLHADWTELTECVDTWLRSVEPQRSHRNYHYITYLRDPVNRFISEWMHVRRGAYWPKEYLCNGRNATPSELPRCAGGGPWRDVTFDEFVGCSHNLAFNRMTRMLANLSLVNCYNRTGLSKDFVDKTLLNSAKENLRAMEFFGLTEEQEKSQFLFEVTFGVLLAKRIMNDEFTRASHIDVNHTMLSVIKEHNDLDIELYKYARGLFTQRVMEAESRVGCNASVYLHSRFPDE
ncbi:heparan-sulfate 6-O-sulfotransferase 3-like [Physella acuta]|uniref:heparan-sulfate 6-O-sulfotransferase 3-like n=1 Tax=Physella acuta TaxID=109671 RepID=UPI0027DD9248|nr:heparan-sulfate 6-O-sulfotransferase 3-like [Physella acuta]